jgi:hypothetical protein
MKKIKNIYFLISVLMSFNAQSHHKQIELIDEEGRKHLTESGVFYEKVKEKVKGFKFASLDDAFDIKVYSIRSIYIYGLDVITIMCILYVHKKDYERIKKCPWSL